MKYFQCCMCKKIEKKRYVFKSNKMICCARKMRVLDKEQCDNETLLNKHVRGK